MYWAEIIVSSGFHPQIPDMPPRTYRPPLFPLPLVGLQVFGAKQIWAACWLGCFLDLWPPASYSTSLNQRRVMFLGSLQEVHVHKALHTVPSTKWALSMIEPRQNIAISGQASGDSLDRVNSPSFCFSHVAIPWPRWLVLVVYQCALANVGLWSDPIFQMVWTGRVQ